MRIDQQRAVRARGSQQIRDQLGGDRRTWLVFTILAAIAVVGNHGGDPASRSAFEGVDHQKQFHQVTVYRAARGLQDEDVCAAHVLLNLNVGFTVLKARDQRLTAADAEEVTDFIGQGLVGGPTKDFELFIYARARFALELVFRHLLTFFFGGRR